MNIRNGFAIFILMTAMSQSHALVKSLALDHLDKLDQIIGLDDKTLSALNFPDANRVLLIRDQNKRYMDLQGRASATFGDKPTLGSGEETCKLTFENAQYVWQAKVELTKTPSHFNKDALENYRKQYKQLRATCDKFIKAQK